MSRRKTEPTEAPRAIGYARVSTDEQANGWSLDAQRAQMEQWCAQNGATLVTVFIDVMTTRRTFRLIGREAAVQAVEAMHSQSSPTGLLVRSLDRASRSIADGALLMHRARSNGWRLRGVDGTDSRDEDQELSVNAKLMVAQEERRLISRRTKEGLERAKANGRILGRQSTVPDSVGIRIVEERGTGKSFAQIARSLDADAIPTPGGSPAWRPAAVRDIYQRHAADAVDLIKQS